jgi:glucose-6-phosphate isomerase
MDENISLDYSGVKKFVAEHEIQYMKSAVQKARERLLSGKDIGNDFQGWINLPIDYDKGEFLRIKQAAFEIQKNSDVLLVIGIGGSYLGARAAIEFLRLGCNNVSAREKDKRPIVYYVGNNLSGTYIQEIINLIKEKSFSINVISKSGTTTESAIAFRIFRRILIEKYGKEEAARRIYSTTDRQHGALKTLSDKEGYQSFVIPDDIGGRFSVLTAVGLLPIAVAGGKIDELMAGAAKGREIALNNGYESNPSLLYASIRNILYRKGKKVEILVNYEPSVHYISEWWKQLFGESEGKDQKGIMPASVDLTTDLHSMGQYIQDGSRIMFETILCVDTPRNTIVLEKEENNLDGLNYLAGKTMDYVNKCAMEGTRTAHEAGGVPCIMVHIPKQDEFSLGKLFYFFEFAVGVSGYVNGINPFDQPGVEFYKANMFKLLGKPNM